MQQHTVADELLYHTWEREEKYLFEENFGTLFSEF